MPVLPIRRFPDPRLKQPTARLARVDGPVTKLIASLISTMRHHPRCVGVAAPQVGSTLRVAVMDASVHPKAAPSHGLLVLVNPTVVETNGAVVQREGCLSVPDFTANVRRAAMAVVEAWDQFGSAYRIRLDGFEAIVAQHEIDHLDGTLFLDRVANVKTDLFRRKTYR